MPQVKPKLIDTGKLQIIYKDFPLDGVALMAAQVARSLPPAQYYPFIEALFASQDDWAFVPVPDPNHPPDYARCCTNMPPSPAWTRRPIRPPSPMPS